MDNQEQTYLEALEIALAIAEDAQEYAQEILAIHMRDLGTSIPRYKARALRIEKDINAAKDAQVLFKRILGLTER